MKKNKTNIVLILAVVGVWALLVYRFFFSGMQQENSLVNPISTTPEKLSVQNKPDRFTLSKITRDPFLDKQQSKPIYGENKSSNLPKKKKEEPPVIKKENTSVKYYGMIKNNTVNKQMALISVDGKQKRMSLGEKFENIKLEKIFKDSCLIYIGKEKLMVKK